jgi:3-hydroxyacyl-[acyl-carrier-protein] dehydratase
MRFLMVDRILELVPGQSAVAEKTLPPDEELFLDHFPGFPVVPGVLLTEMMAQTAGKCLNVERGTRELAVLLEIRSARFRSWVRPGEVATMSAKIVSNAPTVARATTNIHVAGKLICSAELLFAFQPRETFAAEYRDEVLERFLADQTVMRPVSP